jgi:hypothetical protein
VAVTSLQHYRHYAVVSLQFKAIFIGYGWVRRVDLLSLCLIRGGLSAAHPTHGHHDDKNRHNTEEKHFIQGAKCAMCWKYEHGHLFFPIHERIPFIIAALP